MLLAYAPTISARLALSCGVWALVVAVGCSRDSDKVASLPEVTQETAPTSEEAIRAFCADCHVMPSPKSFDRERWHEEVEQGFRLYANSGRDDLVEPDFDATLSYFAADAPEALEFEAPASTPDTRFEAQRLPIEGQKGLSAVSHVINLEPSRGDSPLRLAMADIWTGKISILTRDAPGDPLRSTMIGDVAHPAHVEPTDLDGDGSGDFVVADLGTFNPDGANQASLWFLKQHKAGEFQRRPLKLGLSRLSSVRPLDHDGDGDVDLVVSDFGLHFVGSIYLLTNESVEDGIPKFEWSVLDNRPGAIDTPIVDFNGDGLPDIFTLVSQHYEVVDLHLNKGNGEFESHQLYQAPDPSYGSSGIEVLDFDGDGDLDVVVTNGDTFDDSLAKPYHAIHWLENEGKFPFTHHRITTMPGVYCARAGDLDLDGDMDLVAVSLLGRPEIAKQPPGTFEGVIWLERTGPNEFRRHRILADVCDAATCLLLDWDADGDLDLLVPPANNEQRTSDYLTIYVNTTR